jgi:hypothetical protein
VLLPPDAGTPPVALVAPPVALGPCAGSELHARASSKQEMEMQPTRNCRATDMLSA